MKLLGKLNFSFKNGFSVVMEDASRQENVITKIVERQLFRFNNNIGDWRDAQTKAEHLMTPSRVELIRTYNEVVLDNHLSALMQTRTLKVTGHKFNMVDQEGEIDEEATRLMTKFWFHKFLGFLMESRFWGYNLIQFNDLVDFQFNFIERFPKEHIEPRTQKIRIEHHMLDGIPFDQEPFNNWTFFVGDPKDLGLLNKAAPMTIWKKDALGSWADFSIMFGVPPRIGKSNTRDKVARKALEEALKGMGRLFYAVIDKEDDIEIKDSKRTDAHEVFDELVNRANSEMSKLILGNTMTTDDGSSRSQGEVHERMLESIIKADCVWIENIVNTEFIPWLIEKHQFPLEGLSFQFDMTDTLDLKEQMDLTKDLLEHYRIPEDWIMKKFGIPVEPLGPSAGGVNAVDWHRGTPNMLMISQALSNALTEFYRETPDGWPENAQSQRVIDLDSEEQLYADIHSGFVTIEALPENLYTGTHEQINRAVIAGYGGGVDDFARGSNKFKLLHDLRLNVYNFSAAKTYQQVRAMVGKLRDAQGLIVPFSEFRESAKVIFKQFNEPWLKTEFNTAIAQGQGAADWLRISDQKDVLPLLIYNTIGDSRVRDEHADLDGIIRPVDDSFWSLNFPPNGYNCRCFTDQVDAGTVTPLNRMIDVQNFLVQDIAPVFRMNPGKDRIVFKTNHPYFRVAPGDTRLREANFGLQIPVE